MNAAVFTEHPPYRQVLGGLTSSATPAAGPRGAVVALAGGAGWAGLAVEAARSGAVAVVVDDPGGVEPADLADLAALADLVASGLPVVLGRPRLRPDLARAAADARAGAPVNAVVLECAGSAAAVAGLVRDALGWGRVLAGGELALRAASRSGGGIVALLDAPGALPATLVFTTMRASGGGGLLRASALGETRSEVTVDLVAGSADIDTVTAAGRLRSAPRPESGHRLALRRAIRAVTSGEKVVDLAGFRQDSLLATAILTGAPVSAVVI